jgi:ribosomal protein S18 acetylase RimI-like enzyme
MAESAVGQTREGNISLRPALPDDGDFLLSLYASTREAELQMFGWSEAQLDAFIRMQFNAQTQHYVQGYPGAENKIVCLEGTRIGRLLVDRSREEILLVDIALLPDFRGAGVGGRLIQELLDEADEQGRAVKLHVLQTNPAGRLYQRLGFSVTQDDGIYFEMLRPAIRAAG